MEELVLTPSTVILLAVVAACAVLAVRRLLRRGMCDCDDHTSGSCGHCAKKCAPGSGCTAADDMVKKMQQHL